MHKLNNILLVDDDEIANYIHSDMLRSLDVSKNVTQVCSVEEAIDYLKKAAAKENTVPEDVLDIPDLIFLDINMPGQNGFDFLEQFAALNIPALQKTVVIMLTTSFIKDEVDKADKLKHIVRAYIEKPLKSEIVLYIIDKYFNHTADHVNGQDH